MLDIPEFIERKNERDGDKFVLLVEIEYSPGLYVRWARLDGFVDTSIVFEGFTWTAFGIGNPRRTQNSRGEIPTFDLPLANPERIFQSVLHNYIVEGRPGRLVTVHRDHLDDPSAKVVEWFTVQSANTSARMVNLTCQSVRFNPRRSRIPAKTMTRAEYPGLLGANHRRFY